MVIGQIYQSPSPKLLCRFILVFPGSSRRYSLIMSHVPRKFAPLGLVQPDTGDVPKLDGIVFDVDGTLCKFFWLISEGFRAIYAPISMENLQNLTLSRRSSS